MNYLLITSDFNIGKAIQNIRVIDETAEIKKTDNEIHIAVIKTTLSAIQAKALANVSSATDLSDLISE